MALSNGLRVKTLHATETVTHPAWLRTARIVIAEAYNPPFYPVLEYKPEIALRVVQQLDAEALRYPAASYYAYYPTATAYPVHPTLTGNPMRDTVRLLHEAGKKAVAYVPLNHGFMEVGSTNPRYENWKRRHPDGKPIETGHYGFARFDEGCINSPLRDVIFEMNREVLSYPFEVMYYDGPYQGMSSANDFCYCDYCQSAYRKAKGRAIPLQNSRMTSADEFEYVSWMRNEVIRPFFRQINADVARLRPVPVLFNNTALLSRISWRSHCIADADGFMFESAETPEEKLFNLQLGKSTGKTIWTYVGNHTQYNRIHLKNQDVRSWFSYPLEGAELVVDGAVAVAAGVGLLYWGLSRFFYSGSDVLNLETGRSVKEMNELSAAQTALGPPTVDRPCAGILVSTQTIDWFKGSKFVPEAYQDYFHGAFQLFKQCSYDAEPFLDFEMSARKLKGYKLIYIPNAPCLSDAQCKLLADYVAAGGVLIGTHATSITDERGNPRSDFGLSSLFGVSLVELEPFEYPDLYLKFSDGSTIPQDLQIMRVRAHQGTEVLAETLDRGREQLLGPAVLRRSHGKGTAIYLASGLEAIYIETGMASTAQFFSSLIEPHLSSFQTYRVEPRPGLMPHFASSENALVLHLLANTGNKSKFFRSREQFVSLPNVKVSIRLPELRSVKQITLIRSGKTLEAIVFEGWLNLNIPEILIYDAVRVEFA